MVSAASCALFHEALGWLDPYPAHHLPVVFATAAIVVLVAGFIGARVGVFAGVAAAAGVVLSPRFFADAQNNLKDVPECALYAIAFVAAHRALSLRKIVPWAVAGVAWGAALAQKDNALFLLPQIGVLACAHFVARRSIGRERRRRLSAAGVFFAAGASAFLLLSPQYWGDTVEGLIAHYRHVFATGNAFIGGGDGPSSVSWQGLVDFFTTTPVAQFALAAIGAFHPRLGAVDRAMLVIGVLFPPLRTSLPGMVNYDGVRHFWEFHPFLAALFGAGVHLLHAAASRVASDRLRAWARVAALAPVAWCAVDVYRYAPDGTCYFNAFVGGLSGAQERGLTDATDYWGNSYWREFDRLNRLLEPNAVLVVPVAPEVVSTAAPLRLRKDIRLVPPKAGAIEAPLYLAYVTRPEWYPSALEELDRKAVPVFERLVAGAPVYRVLRFDAGEHATIVRDVWRILRVVGQVRELKGAAAFLQGWVGGDVGRLKLLLDVLLDADEASYPKRRDELLAPDRAADLDKLRAALSSDVA